MKKLLLGLLLVMSLIAYGKEEIKYDHYRKMDEADGQYEKDRFYKFKEVERTPDDSDGTTLDLYYIDDEEQTMEQYEQYSSESHEASEGEKEKHNIYRHNREFDKDFPTTKYGTYNKGEVRLFEAFVTTHIRHNTKSEFYDGYVGDEWFPRSEYCNMEDGSHEVD